MVELNTSKVFDIKRDNELIAVGSHFWCEGHMTARPIDDQSPDPRYCLVCYDFLLQEAKIVIGHKKAAWAPRKNATQRIRADANQEIDTSPMSSPRGGIMSHKRGPKHRVLPEDLIKKLAAANMGSRPIAAHLESECGLKISYKTVQRILSGQRVLV
jgi:hypothetical protein